MYKTNNGKTNLKYSKDTESKAQNDDITSVQLFCSKSQYSPEETVNILQIKSKNERNKTG
jgi:hypothetical protein